MTQYDILLNIDGNLEWITGIYTDTVNDAITCAIRSVGRARYVGHKVFVLESDGWEEI